MSKPNRPTSASEADQQVMRALRLLRAWRKPTPTVVDGIIFNFDCEIDKGEWHPLCPLGVYSDLTTVHAPELVFPWTPDFVREALNQREPIIPLVEVTAGCSVAVASISAQLLASTFAEFASPEQRYGKLAHLSVTRPSGTMEIVRHPLILLRSTAIDALLIARDYQAAFNGLVEQLEQRTGLANIEDFADRPLETWPKPRDDISSTYRAALSAFLKGCQTVDREPYVAFGYLMAKAEAKVQLLALATKGRQAAEYQARAAGGRRQKSRQETEKLRIIARRLIEQNPDISLSGCARDVEKVVCNDPRWKFKSDAKWISGHIKELFEPRTNGREYRPKRLS